MSDVLLVIITIAFFGVCVLLVRACDSIIGPDADDLLDKPDSATNATEPSESASTDGDEVLTGAAS